MQVPFEIPGLAVLGVRHEDIILSAAVASKWQQQQLQRQQGQACTQPSAPLSSVLGPRSCPEAPSSLQHSFSSNFLADCEFSSAAEVFRLTPFYRLFFTASNFPGDSCFGPPTGSQVHANCDDAFISML